MALRHEIEDVDDELPPVKMVGVKTRHVDFDKGISSWTGRWPHINHELLFHLSVTDIKWYCQYREFVTDIEDINQFLYPSEFGYEYWQKDERWPGHDYSISEERWTLIKEEYNNEEKELYEASKIWYAHAMKAYEEFQKASEEGTWEGDFVPEIPRETSPEPPKPRFGKGNTCATGYYRMKRKLEDYLRQGKEILEGKVEEGKVEKVKGDEDEKPAKSGKGSKRVREEDTSEASSGRASKHRAKSS